MNFLQVTGISKQQEQDKHWILQDISFTQQQFTKLAIAGETGSGKSTLLKIIAGLAQPDNGQVYFEDVRVLGPYEQLIPGHKGIAYLQQNFDLPHFLRVEQVLEYVNELPEAEAQTLYEVCRINHLMKRRTDQLSGGEKQRIAMARLLIGMPRLLLMDEPFSNLDMIHKNILKSVIRDIGERLHISCILISHDPMDSLSWADEIIVMRNAAIVQQGTPYQLYRQPVNEYVAGLLGRYNLVPASAAGVFANIPGLSFNDKSLFARPEHFRLVASPENAAGGQISEVLYYGGFYELDIALPGQNITVRTDDAGYQKGDTVYVTIVAEDAWYI